MSDEPKIEMDVAAWNAAVAASLRTVSEVTNRLSKCHEAAAKITGNPDYNLTGEEFGLFLYMKAHGQQEVKKMAQALQCFETLQEVRSKIPEDDKE